MKTLGRDTLVCFIALACLLAAVGFSGAGTRMEYRGRGASGHRKPGKHLRYGRSVHRSASFYGSAYIQLAAPGSAILSTTKEGGYASGYGTSMACPHVAGAAALIAAAHPGETAGQIRSRILNYTTANANLTGKVSTGGYLNVAAAISGTAPPAPTPSIGGSGGCSLHAGNGLMAFLLLVPLALLGRKAR